MEKCPNCDFFYSCETETPKCPRCGCGLSSCYEKVKPTDHKDNAPTAVRIQSEKDNYYEFDPSTSPLWEEAGGNSIMKKRKNMKILFGCLCLCA